MSILFIRTCLNADVSLNLCSRWQRDVGKFCQTRLQLPFNSSHSLKTSQWNQSRWPGRRYQANSAVQQDEFALSRLLKPLGFTIAVSGFSMAGAAIWQYENVRHQASLASIWMDRQTPKYGQFRQHIHKWWQNLSAADKVFAPICAINVLVFLAWMVPAWHPIMTRYFTAGLSSNFLCWPMLFSVFSHYSIFHLGANMFVLHSFSEKAVSALGKEQFLGVYLSAGMISSFTSYFYKALIRTSTTSLGASGAVMCVLGYVCTKYPHSQLAVIFLPQFPFEAGTGLKALVGMDALGCILRWSFLDHAAHLGGSLFGIIWYYWGHDLIWRKREPLVSAWHKFRGPVQ